MGDIDANMFADDTFTVPVSLFTALFFLHFEHTKISLSKTTAFFFRPFILERSSQDR